MVIYRTIPEDLTRFEAAVFGKCFCYLFKMYLRPLLKDVTELFIFSCTDQCNKY